MSSKFTNNLVKIHSEMANQNDKKITVMMDNPGRNFTAVENEPNQHQYIQFTNGPRNGAVTEAGFLIVEQLFGNKQTRKKWRDDKNLYIIEGENDGGQPVRSTPLNYLTIGKYIRDHGYFERLDFNLLPLECRWLDFSMDLKLDKPIINEDGKMVSLIDGTPEQNYGKVFPIEPKLDREGRSFTSMFPLLIRRVVRSRTRLVDESRLAITADWLLDLRSLVGDTISLIEITLHQLYIKAEYDPLPGWKFDKSKLGERHGRRLVDKLKWVFQISGNSPRLEPHMAACHRLRELRNHFSHFDPPTLVVTVEEATGWLNDIIDIGYLLIEIRKAIRVQVSFDLINFILQKDLFFVPIPGYEERVSLANTKTGYISSQWPK